MPYRATLMGVKVPPVWRKRSKATVNGSKMRQPPEAVVLPLRVLIELSKQLIFTFAAIQLVLSFSLGSSIFQNLRRRAEFDAGLPSGFPCPPGANYITPGYTSCAAPTYANHPDGFFGWLASVEMRDGDSQWQGLLLLVMTFMVASTIFTVALAWRTPRTDGDSVAGTRDVCICCALASAARALYHSPLAPMPAMRYAVAHPRVTPDARLHR